MGGGPISTTVALSEIDIVYSGWQVLLPVAAIFLAGFTVGYIVRGGSNDDE